MRNWNNSNNYYIINNVNLRSNTMKQKIIDKLNKGQEIDVSLYTWETIPQSLKRFWLNYYKNKYYEDIN